MNTSPSSNRFAKLLLTACCLASVGCVDTIDTVLRDRLALATENLDVIMHVVDQESAKEYNKIWRPRMEGRISAFDERQRKVEDNMDKKDYKEWQAHAKYIKECIDKKEKPEIKKPKPDEKDPEPPLTKFRLYYARERVACELALAREATRLAKVIADLQARGAESGEVNGVLGSLGGAVKK